MCWRAQGQHEILLDPTDVSIYCKLPLLALTLNFYLLIGPTRQLLKKSISSMPSVNQKKHSIFFLKWKYPQILCSHKCHGLPGLGKPHLAGFPSWECLRSLLGSCRAWHLKGREGGKHCHFFPLLLWRFSPGMFCCNPSHFNKIICLLFFFASIPAAVLSNNSGHAFSYLICRCHVTVLISFFLFRSFLFSIRSVSFSAIWIAYFWISDIKAIIFFQILLPL